MNRENILERFYKLKEERKEFYEKHPELLEQLNLKIKALEEGNYKIVDGCWIIAYVSSKITEQQIMTGKEETLEKRKGKQVFTIEQAKEIMQEFQKFESFKNR